MTQDVHQAHRAIVEFCTGKWVEADRDAQLSPDLKTGKKMAYNDVLQYARKLSENG